jgi:hypothetical protein
MVVFDRGASQVATRLFGDDIFFGRFERGSRQLSPGHTVLLMRLSNGVIADWSHNGACIVWRNKDVSDAPPLMRAHYNSYLFRKRTNDRTRDAREAADVYDHIGSPQYDWQARVANVILEMTGIRIPRDRYRI